MAQIGRALIEEGEAVWFRVDRELTRAQNYTFTSPRRYQITNPDGLRTMNDDRVFHVRWNLQVASGRGLAPLGKLIALIAERIAHHPRLGPTVRVGYPGARQGPPVSRGRRHGYR
ncbi:MAG: hypothetical protein OXN84_19270 [Albidovulum sp.]|nr:hypothetical protein [Albidovulum sp.]